MKAISGALVEKLKHTKSALNMRAL